MEKTSIERRLMSFQPSLGSKVTWQDLLHVAPKLLAVGSMFEMCKLVNHDIFKHPLRGKYQTPINIYCTFCAT